MQDDFSLDDYPFILNKDIKRKNGLKYIKINCLDKRRRYVRNEKGD